MTDKKLFSILMELHYHNITVREAFTQIKELETNDDGTNYHIKTIFLSLLTTIIIGIAFTQGTVKYFQNNIFDYIGLYVIAITLCLFLFYIAYVKIFQTIGD